MPADSLPTATTSATSDPTATTTTTITTTTHVSLRLGTRNSELALKQTTMAMTLLEQNHPHVNWSVVSMTTTGDQILNAPLHQIGSKSLFTKELEVALQENQVDLVVHSYKDVPTTLPVGMTIGAVCRREDPRDVVVMSRQSMDKGYRRLENLPEGSQVGTSSVRRIAQLSKWLPGLVCKDIRGNLNTRLRKLDDQNSPYAAIVLAYAGVHRLGWNDRISEILDPFPQEASTSYTISRAPKSSFACLHAVSQGAMAIECRKADLHILRILEAITDVPTLLETSAERALMRTLEGGCSVPIGVACRWERPSPFDSAEAGSLQARRTNDQGKLTLYAVVCAVDGRTLVEATGCKDVGSSVEIAESLGREVAQELLNQGAREILAAVRPKMIGGAGVSQS